MPEAASTPPSPSTSAVQGGFALANRPQPQAGPGREGKDQRDRGSAAGGPSSQDTHAAAHNRVLSDAHTQPPRNAPSEREHRMTPEPDKLAMHIGQDAVTDTKTAKGTPMKFESERQTVDVR